MRREMVQESLRRLRAAQNTYITPARQLEQLVNGSSSRRVRQVRLERRHVAIICGIARVHAHGGQEISSGYNYRRNTYTVVEPENNVLFTFRFCPLIILYFTVQLWKERNDNCQVRALKYLQHSNQAPRSAGQWQLESLGPPSSP